MSDPIISFGTEFLVDLASAFAVRLTEKALGLWQLLDLPPRNVMHFRELRTKILDMPFIYKDLEADLTNDFVELEFQSAEVGTAGGTSAIAVRIPAHQKLKDRPRALIMGGAGIGKTTFLRHSVMELIDSGGISRFFFEGQKLVPFYVPLKALDPTVRFPIVQYLLRNNGLFRRNGLSRLKALSLKRKVFCVLDGYDEIPLSAYVSGNAEGYVMEELRFIFQPERFARESARIPAEYKEIYFALQDCRLWLSSRREFYESNALPMDPLGYLPMQGKPIQRTAAIEIAGIGPRRIELVKRIFEKYRRRNPKLRELLNEEYFMQDLDRAYDRDLVSLSYSPLFLTVMCYIYARSVIDSGDFRVNWASNLRVLIMECINLLLKDLDEEKARDMNPVQRAALVRRRAEFPAEKIDFLRYLAYRLLLTGKAVFTVEFLKAEARKFFESSSESSMKARIVQDLSADGPNAPHIANQLIFSGIFVLVDRIASQATYDFPHRRFREVLAAEQLEIIENRSEAIRVFVERPDLAEALYVFYELTSAKDEIVHEVFERISNGRDESRMILLLGNMVSKIGSRHDFAKIARGFIIQWAEKNEPHSLPLGIIKRLGKDTSFLDNINKTAQRSLSQNDVPTFALCCDVLKYSDPSGLRGLLQNTNLSGRSDEIVLISLKLGIETEVPWGTTLLNEDLLKHCFLLFCQAMVGAECADDSIAALAVPAISKLDLPNRARLILTLSSLRPPLLQEIRAYENLEDEVTFIIGLLRFSDERLSDAATRKFRPYVITKGAINLLPEKRRTDFQGRIGVSFSDLGFVRSIENEMDVSDFIKACTVPLGVINAVAKARIDSPIGTRRPMTFLAK